MEVIRPGREQAGWSKEFECVGSRGIAGCGALLRVTKEDLFKRNEHDISGRHVDTIMTCPCCGAQSVIKGEKFQTLPDEKEWTAANPERSETTAALRAKLPQTSYGV